MKKRLFRILTSASIVAEVIGAACFGCSAMIYVYNDGVVSSAVTPLGVVGGTVFISSIFAHLFIVASEFTFMKA